MFARPIHSNQTLNQELIRLKKDSLVYATVMLHHSFVFHPALYYIKVSFLRVCDVMVKTPYRREMLQYSMHYISTEVVHILEWEFKTYLIPTQLWVNVPSKQQMMSQMLEVLSPM